jgi:hypothetical protein
MHQKQTQSGFSPPATMTPNDKRYHQPGQSGFSPLALKTPNNRNTGWFDCNEDLLSPQSSKCVRSTSSQEPLLNRGELVGMMETISTYARHFASAYHGIGCSYHSLPFSARRSQWVVEGMRVAIDEALTASQYKQLPDLVYMFSEISHRLSETQYLLYRPGADWQAAKKISHRLSETQYLLYRPGADWQAAKKQLRRCDMLLQEAELRLRFLQTGVGNMWFTVGRDDAVSWDEGEVLATSRTAFESRWLSVLPQICFTNHVQSIVQSVASKEHQSGRRWVSWSG